MGKKLQRTVNLIVISLLPVVTFLIWHDNPIDSGWRFVFAIVFIIIYVVTVFFQPLHGSTNIGKGLLLVQLGLVGLIILLDGGFVGLIFLFILIGDASIESSRFFGMLFTILAYLCFVFGHWVYYQFPPFSEISYVIPRSLEFIAIYGLGYLIKIAYQQKQQLELTNEQLKNAAGELEQKVLLQERTRISREIHDTVGHSLTAALSGLQAAIHLADRDSEKAVDMMNRTYKQVQLGLEDVRRSVHTLKDGPVFPAFVPALLALMEKMELQTFVKIFKEIDEDFPKISPLQEITLYRALQEGLTNGVRHGKSTEFLFSLRIINEQLQFTLTDNGCGWKGQTFGFGLLGMQERVNEAMGTLTVTPSKTGRGTTLLIELPYHG